MPSTMTQTIEQIQQSTQPPTQSSPQILVLRLKQRSISIDNNKNEKRVTWDEAVIDNEHMNKKKTKSCCVFCKKKKYDNLFLP
jgi:protein phosphatase 1 regulatory subunit 11